MLSLGRGHEAKSLTSNGMLPHHKTKKERDGRDPGPEAVEKDLHHPAGVRPDTKRFR